MSLKISEIKISELPGRMKSWCMREYYWLSPILIFLSFPSYDFVLLNLFPFWAWFSLVPLFMYIRNKPLKTVFVKSFGASLLACFLCYSWIGEFGAVVPGGSFVILIFLIPTLGVFMAVKIIAAEILSRRFEKYRLFIFPSVWIIIDWVHSIGFLAFPWAYWGYSQYPFTPFVQTASVTGIFGITFILILSNVTAAGLLDRIVTRGGLAGITGEKIFRTAVVFYGLTAAVVLAGAVSLFVEKREGGPDDKMRLAMVQSCIDPWDSWSRNRFRYLSELLRLTDMAVKENPDMVIWSESATLETIYYDYHRGRPDSFQRQISDYVRLKNVPLLTGEIGIVERFSSGYYHRYPENSAVLINTDGVPEAAYAKIHLVPIGEWFPYEKWMPIVKKVASSFGASSFVPGNEPKIFTVNGFNFGVLICYEGIFHRLCRKYSELGADFLINITNDGWTDHYSGHMQHFSASVFRAVENGIWLVRAGNTGYTGFIDPRGRVTDSIPILKPGYIAGEIDISANRKTVYSVIGDAVLYVAMIFIIILSFVFLKEFFRGRRDAPE